jgi:TRAP-type C4-dicarboxylate transport system permease small subunit
MTKKANNTAATIETVFEKVVLYVDRFLLGIGGVAVVLIMTLATVNVALRLFSLPLRGVYEIITYMGAVAVASALGYTQRRKDHIIVDIITEKYGRTSRRIADTISYLLMTVFFFLIAKTLFTWGLFVSASGEVSETLKIAYYPFVLFVSAGFVMLSVTCLADTVRTLFNLKVRNVE